MPNDITDRSTGISSALGFRATRNDDDSLTIHRVPIFVRCKRGDHDFNDAWIAKAVKASRLAESEGYLPPLHIRHHGPADDDVQAVGVFRVLGSEVITFKGNPCTAILADLIITCPSAQHEVMGKRLPYRSVEIFDVDSPRIDGLALLDHEAPFLELPMLVVNQVSGDGRRDDDGVRTIVGTGVAGATFGRGWSMDANVDTPGVVACFQRGRTAHFLLETDPMKTPEQIAAEKILADAQAALNAANFAADEGGKPDEKKEDEKQNAEGDGGGGIDAKAVAKAISDGTIPMGDFQMILDAVEAAKSTTAPADDTADAPAPAATPGEAMRGMTPAMAALQGRVEAAEGNVARMQADTARVGHVAGAMTRLEGKPLGSDLEARLIKFHADHGQAAFNAYVDSMDKTTGVAPDTLRGADQFGGAANGGVPAEAMKYEKDGADAVERATKFAREWKQLSEGGHTRMAEARYIEVNMERATA